MLDKPSVRLRFLMGRFLIFLAVLFVLGLVAILFFAKMDERVYADGYVTARHREDVRSLNAGVLTTVLVRDGDHVQRGDVLATLDDTDIRRKLDREREAVARAEAELAVAQRKLAKLALDTLPEKLRFVEMDYKQAQLQAQLAESEWKTAAKLVDDGVVSSLEVEKLRTRYELTQNALEVAQKRVELVRAGLAKAILDEARADERVARQALESRLAECKRLEEDLERSIIRAGASGWVILAPKRPGESVQSGELVFRIQTTEALELRVFVPEDQVMKIEQGQRVLIYSAMFPYEKYGLAEGRVRTVASSAEEVKGRAAYLVRIDIERSPLPLRVGSTAQARILIQRRSILEMLMDPAA